MSFDDDELTDSMNILEAEARERGREELAQRILTIHEPAKRDDGRYVCAECRDMNGRLTIDYPCRTARLALGTGE